MNDNKDYINTFIKRQRIISIICISFVLLSSTISAMAVSAYLYNSNEVSYNNNASGITSTNVQGAIDELYEHATDYTNMNTRVSALEGHFQNNPTIYLDGNWLRVKSTSSSTRGVAISDNSNITRSYFYYSPSEGMVRIDANNSSGNTGQGEFKILGKPITLGATAGGNGDINLNGNVKFNGTSVNDLYVYQDYTNSSTSLTAGTIGAYVTMENIDVSKSGYTPISCSFKVITHPGSYDVNCFLDGSTLTIFYYRATSTAYTISAGDLKVRILYKKTV